MHKYLHENMTHPRHSEPASHEISLLVFLLFFLKKKCSLRKNWEKSHTAQGEAHTEAQTPWYIPPPYKIVFVCSMRMHCVVVISFYDVCGRASPPFFFFIVFFFLSSFYLFVCLVCLLIYCFPLFVLSLYSCS